MIICLWDRMKALDPAISQNASNQLNQLFQNPEIIIPILGIATKSNDPYILANSIVNIKALLRRHNYPPDYLETHVKPCLLNLLPNNFSLNNKQIIIDCLTDKNYLSDNTQNINQYFPVVMSMLQNDNLKAAGLYFMGKLLDANHIQIFSPDLINGLYSLCLQFLMKYDYDLNSVAYSFLTQLFEVPELFEQMIGSFEPVSKQLINIFHQLYLNESSYDPTDYFTLISTMIVPLPDYFINCFGFMINAIKENFLNRNASLTVRMASIIVLTTVAYEMPDIILSDINGFIDALALFTFELVETECDIANLYFPSEIYNLIAETLFEEIEPSEILHTFMPVINKLYSLNSPISIMIIFMILDTLLKICMDPIEENFDHFQNYLNQALSSNSQILFEQGVEFIDIFCKESETIANRLMDLYEPSLLNLASSDAVLNCLITMYDVSSKEPADYQKSISALIGQLTNTATPLHIERTINALSYLIINSPKIEEEIIMKITPFLFQLITMDNDGMRVGIFCFSAITYNSPSMVKNFLPILDSAIERGLASNDFLLMQTCATTINNLVDFLPNSFAPFCPKYLNMLMTIFENKKNVAFLNDDDNDDDDKDEEERNQAQKQLQINIQMLRDVFNTIAVIFNSYAEQLVDSSDLIAEKLISLLIQKDYRELLTGAYYAVREIIPAFYKINKDPQQIFYAFLETKQYLEDDDTTREYWDTIAIVVTICGKPLLLQYGQLVFESFKDIFVNTKLYSVTKKKFKLNDKLIYPITKAFSRFFCEFGSDGAMYAQDGLNMMQRLIQTTNKAKGQASRAISYIIKANSPQLNGIIPQIIGIIAPLISSSSDDTREAAFDTFNTFLYLDPGAIQNQCEKVIQSVNEVIQNNSKYSKGLFESAINVWCSIMMIYKLPISPDQFQTILENFPPDPNSVNLEYASHFAVYAINNLQNIFPFEKFVDTAINIFSSNDFILRSINIEEASLLANSIKTSSPESLNDHSGSDERSLMNLQQHIQRF